MNRAQDIEDAICCAESRRVSAVKRRGEAKVAMRNSDLEMLSIDLELRRLHRDLRKLSFSMAQTIKESNNG